jgi:hypothetical protein
VTSLLRFSPRSDHRRPLSSSLAVVPVDGLLDLLDPQVRMLVQLPHLECPGLTARLDLEACRDVWV